MFVEEKSQQRLEVVFSLCARLGLVICRGGINNDLTVKCLWWSASIVVKFSHVFSVGVIIGIQMVAGIPSDF